MKTVIITGASGSVGEAATLIMAHKGWHVILACRNLEKGNIAMKRIMRKCSYASLELLHLEMSSYDSIKTFAKSLEGRRIDALFNNAGIMCRTFERTEEGLERTLAVNYLGTIRLTELILPLIPIGGHIVNMVSLTARFGKFKEEWCIQDITTLDTQNNPNDQNHAVDWRRWDGHDFGQLKTYARSKKGVLLYSKMLAHEHPELHVNVSDPGIVNSNMITMQRWYDPLADIFFRPFIKTPEQGAIPAINALLTDKTNHYFVGKGFMSM